VIALHDVTVRYGPQSVVGAVREHVEAGEWVAVIGPNGAGKTTILRAMARLVPFEGEIWIGAAASSALSP